MQPPLADLSVWSRMTTPQSAVLCYIGISVGTRNPDGSPGPLRHYCRPAAPPPAPPPPLAAPSITVTVRIGETPGKQLRTEASKPGSSTRCGACYPCLGKAAQTLCERELVVSRGAPRSY